MPVRSSPAARDPLLGRVLTGLLTGRLVAGPGVDDAVRIAGELVADGRLVALEHSPAPGAGAADELAALIGEVHARGLQTRCELTLPPDLGAIPIHRLADAAAAVGLAVAVTDGTDVPDATVLVRSGDPAAEARCHALAGRRVRLVHGRGAAAGLAFVRCLNVLMAGAARPGIATSDPRLIAIAGERAAWYGRAPDSWEHVMPYGILTDEQHRLVAGGYVVRAVVPSGAGAVSALVRRFGGRS